jgi:hypothetical protein
MIKKYAPEKFEEFVLDCIRYSFSETDGRKGAEHERAHFDKLIELGYSPDYYVIILYDSSDPLLVGASIDFDESKVSPKDLALISLAPKDPSFRDLRTARKVLSKLEVRNIWEAKRTVERVT